MANSVKPRRIDLVHTHKLNREAFAETVLARLNTDRPPTLEDAAPSMTRNDLTKRQFHLPKTMSDVQSQATAARLAALLMALLPDEEIVQWDQERVLVFPSSLSVLDIRVPKDTGKVSVILYTHASVDREVDELGQPADESMRRLGMLVRYRHMPDFTDDLQMVFDEICRLLGYGEILHTTSVVKLTLGPSLLKESVLVVDGV